MCSFRKYIVRKFAIKEGPLGKTGDGKIKNRMIFLNKKELTLSPRVPNDKRQATSAFIEGTSDFP